MSALNYTTIPAWFRQRLRFISRNIDGMTVLDRGHRFTYHKSVSRFEIAICNLKPNVPHSSSRMNPMRRLVTGGDGLPHSPERRARAASPRMVRMSWLP